MKSKLPFLIILAVLVFSAGWLSRNHLSSNPEVRAQQDTYYCPMHPEIQSDKPGNCPICHMDLVKKDPEPQVVRSKATTEPSQKEQYYCPMHPQIQSDKPGTCPICYMNLVKKEQPSTESASAAQPARPSQEICLLHNCHRDGHICPMMVVTKPGETVHCPICGTFIATEQGLVAVEDSSARGYAAVKISPQKQQLIGVRTATVVKQPLSRTIHTYGYVAHDLELYDAQLEYIYAWHAYYPYIARRLVKDEYRADWREYYSKPLEGNRWRSDEKLKAQQTLIKAEYELIHMGITNEQLRQLREVKYGQPWIQPELLFFEKGQPRWVFAQVFENELGYIAVGQKASVHIPAYGDRTDGVVKAIDPVVDPVTRTIRVRIELPTYPSDLSINMYVDVDIFTELDTSLVIPREAVMDTGVKKIVFVQGEEGQFIPREVRTGLEGDGHIAVRSGLQEGDTIVVSGNFLLDSESRLKAALEGMETTAVGVPAEKPAAAGGQHVH